MLKRKTPLAVLVALGGVGDADARGGGEPDARAVAFKPQSIGANEVFAVERAVDLEKLRQPSGAFRAFHATDEHRLGTPFRPRHDVQHFVHPVAEIDVGAAARRVHHIRPRRAPLVSARSLADVRKGFIWAKVLDEPRFKRRWSAQYR